MNRLDRDWLLAAHDLCPGGPDCARRAGAVRTARACACRVALAFEAASDGDLGSEAACRPWRGRVLGVRRAIPCPHRGSGGEVAGTGGETSDTALDLALYDALWVSRGVALFDKPGLRGPRRLLLAQAAHLGVARACAELRIPIERLDRPAGGEVATRLGEATGLGPGWGHALAGRCLAGGHLDLFLDATLRRRCGLGPVRAREQQMAVALGGPEGDLWALGGLSDIARRHAAVQHLVQAVPGRVLPDGRVRCGGLCYAEVVRADRAFRVLPWWAGEEVAVRPWYAAPAHAYVYAEGERIAHVAVDRALL